MTTSAPTICPRVLSPRTTNTDPTRIELASAGVKLGTTYPLPIIDHKAGRERALAAYAKVRAG